MNKRKKIKIFCLISNREFCKIKKMTEQRKKIALYRIFRGDFSLVKVQFHKYLVDALEYLHQTFVDAHLYQRTKEEFFEKVLMVGLETVLEDFSKIVHTPTEHEILALAIYDLKKDVEERLDELLKEKELFRKE